MLNLKSVVDETCTALNMSVDALNVAESTLFESGDGDEALARSTIVQRIITDQVDAITDAINNLREHNQGNNGEGQPPKEESLEIWPDYDDYSLERSAAEMETMGQLLRGNTDWDFMDLGSIGYFLEDQATVIKGYLKVVQRETEAKREAETEPETETDSRRDETEDTALCKALIPVISAYEHGFLVGELLEDLKNDTLKNLDDYKPQTETPVSQDGDH